MSRSNPNQEHKTTSVRDTNQKFQEFIKEHDGEKFLSEEELKTSFVEIKHSRNPELRVWRAMSKAVEDRDDHISHQEMEALPQKRTLKNMTRRNSLLTQEDKSTSTVPYTKDQLREFFKQHDKDGDKFLSKAELTKAFEDLQARFPRVRVWEAMGKADADGDKRISQQEMEALVDHVVGLKYHVRA